MRYLFLIIFLFLFGLHKSSIAQPENMILNGSFEFFERKPAKEGELPLLNVSNPAAKDSTSPDYYRGRFPRTLRKVTPQDGKGMIGLICYHDQNENIPYREYVTLALGEKMRAGHRYKISFYIRNNFVNLKQRINRRNAAFTGRYYLDQIGLSFSTTKIFQDKSLPLEPDCYYPVEINDYYYHEWHYVELTIEASEDAKYVTVGSFQPDSLIQYDTQTEQGKQPYAYYFFDNFTMIENEYIRDYQLVNCMSLTKDLNLDTLAQQDTVDVVTEKLLKDLDYNDILELETIQFVADSSTLLSESMVQLAQVGAVLKRYPNIRLEIGGHTNSNCDQNYCLELSEKRAESVKNALVRYGASPENLSVKGYGKEMPKYDNKNKRYKQLNQRVELKRMPLVVTQPKIKKNL